MSAILYPKSRRARETLTCAPTPMAIVLFICIVVIGLAACLAVGLSIGLVIRANRIREALKIPAVPMLVPTPAEQVPPDLAAFLADVVPALSRLGFDAVASVHAPQMMVTVTWTQVLFLRRDRGDRASVMLLRPTTPSPDGTPPTPPSLAFATELPGGRSVKTSTQHHAEDLPTLYDRHRVEVTRTLGADAVGEVPEPGAEVPWMQARAGLIAATLAEVCKFVPTPQGGAYRPTWRIALRAAWNDLWAQYTRQRRYGFEVQSTTESR